ncbi:MAG: RNA methyltransferase [Caulobacter sp.]|nr:RNA methyltransferase [Caulobacter sp.]
MPDFIEVSDPSDPRIEAYREIRERDLVGRRGLFIAEGEVVLRLLTRSRTFETLSVLIASRRRESLAEILALLPPATPVYLAEQSVLDRIAGFPLHRGILAVARRNEPPDCKTLLSGLGPEALVLALSGISNHDNMGGLFRNAAAFGVDAVVLTSDCCDPLYRKAIRVSVGGVLVTPYGRLQPGEDLVDILVQAGLIPLALSPAGTQRLADLERLSRAAVIVGAEGPGLPAAMLARCRTVAIPMAAGFDSLNVSTTGGIVLHHLRSH